MEDAEREKIAMKRLPKKPTVLKDNQVFPDFELDADETSPDNNRLTDTRDMVPQTDYRVWRCNGVPIGVRIHKK